jgi:hypothetical protein
VLGSLVGAATGLQEPGCRQAGNRLHASPCRGGNYCVQNVEADRETVRNDRSMDDDSDSISMDMDRSRDHDDDSSDSMSSPVQRPRRARFDGADEPSPVRHLDPRAGRFTSRGASGMWGDDGLGNGSSYAGNNSTSGVGPIKWMSPETMKN